MKLSLSKSAPASGYVAVVGLNVRCTEDDPEGQRVEPGEPVPGDVVSASPWLVDQRLVLTAAEYAAAQAEPQEPAPVEEVATHE